MPGDNMIALARGSVLYLGSAVPLETSVGLEALQMPLRDRYLTSDQSQKVSGIDSILTVFSSGLLMQYPGDDSSSTWFPMQTLHMCAAVRAVNNQGSTRFVSIDSPQTLATREPPIFAVIMRRSRGVKVLECHVFVCKSTDAALAFVQSCTHAFQHQEGWLNGMPGSDQFQLSGGGMSRIVAADAMSGMGDMPRTPLQGFMYGADQPTHMYNITGMDAPVQAPVPVQAPAPAAPAPVQAAQPAAVPMQYIAMNPPGAPVPQFQQMTIPQGYFADWDQNYGMSYMIIPNSPFYPGDAVYNQEKKKKKKKKKKPKKKKKVQEEEEEEEEEELYYVRRSKLDQVPPEFVPVQQGEERYVIQRQTADQWTPADVRYTSQPMGPPPQVQMETQNNGGTEIHYIPLPRSAQNPPPPAADQPIQSTAADIVHFARMPTDSGLIPYDPYSFRAQPADVDYDYRREYDAARQQAIYGTGPQQMGVYDRRLPRTALNYDERGFDGMVDRLGYFP